MKDRDGFIIIYSITRDDNLEYLIYYSNKIFEVKGK